MMSTPILDACCGSRMFWFNKEHPAVLFMDNRQDEYVMTNSRNCFINPDIIGDFTDMPFHDCSFKLVVFDPPHLRWIGKKSYIGQKYGQLPVEWQSYIRRGFKECMRVLDDYGTLIFKWSEHDIPLNNVIEAIGYEPLFGNRSGKSTHWITYMKCVSKPLAQGRLSI